MVIVNYIYSSIITLILVAIVFGYGFSYALTKEKIKIACGVWFLLYIFGEILRMTFVVLPSSIPFGTDSRIVSYYGSIVPLCYVVIIKLESGKPVRRSEKIVISILLLAIIVMIAFNITTEMLLAMFYIWAPFELYPGMLWTKRRKTFFTASVFLACIQILNRFLLPLIKSSTPGLSLSVCSELMLYLSIVLGIADIHTCVKTNIKRMKTNANVQNRDDISRLDQIVSDCGLSGREQEIIHMLLEGKSNKEIAESLFITEGTVKTHVHNMFQKLGISSRIELYSMLYSGKE